MTTSKLAEFSLRRPAGPYPSLCLPARPAPIFQDEQIVCDDDTFWQWRILEGFDLPLDNTARRFRWKTTRRRWRKPRVYVWGETTAGRSGPASVPDDKPVPEDSAPWPLLLLIDQIGSPIVTLAAAATSFFAIDSEEQLYVWGTLDVVGFSSSSTPWFNPDMELSDPTKLVLPAATRAISCGRAHATMLDGESNVWIFLSFDCPFRLVTPFLDAHSPDTCPHQVTSGWSFSAALTKAGDIYVWFPWHENMARVVEQQDDTVEEPLHTEDDVILCRTLDFHDDPHKLPALPPLPSFTTSTDIRSVYLVKITGLDNSLIGLTNAGHVLKINLEGGKISAWEYLPYFSEPDKIRNKVVSAAPDIQLPDHIQITHVSAWFRTFAAYITGYGSVVLLGEEGFNAATTPKNIPALQNRNIISIVIGDYHYGALTATGELLTWGSFSHGALGLGNPTEIQIGCPGGYSNPQHLADALSGKGFETPPPSDIPTRVRFDHYEERNTQRFCLAATAAGWHMGALVVDLEDEEEGDELNISEASSSNQESTQTVASATPYVVSGLDNLNEEEKDETQISKPSLAEWVSPRETASAVSFVVSDLDATEHEKEDDKLQVSGTSQLELELVHHPASAVPYFMPGLHIAQRVLSIRLFCTSHGLKGQPQEGRRF